LVQTEKLERVVFYGATRFEAPRLGHTFRGSDRRVLTVVEVKSEYIGNHTEDFTPRAWKFIADCRPLTPEELRRYGREEDYYARRSRN
jgi:hypothetical protein